MFTTPEQFSTAAKAGFGAQFETFAALTGKALESVEKVVDLNLSLAKASFEETTANAKQLFGAKDAQEFFALSAAQIQPNAQKAFAYSRHLANIATGAQAELTKAAEAQIAETNRKVIELVDQVAKNAPAGSENAIAMVKTAVGNTTAGFEQLSKTTKQAVEALETNFAAAAEQFAQTGDKATARAKK